MRETLKKARRERGFTQQVVAERIPISLNYYKKIEGGARLGAIDIWDRLEDLFSIPQRELRVIPRSRPFQEGSP